MMRRRSLPAAALFAALAAAFSVGLFGPVRLSRAQEATVTVFAAASLKNALDDANAAFTRETGTKVVASYAATSALVRQIEQGAPADVFLSADLRWMDHAIRSRLVKADTRTNLLGNRLVMIAPADATPGMVGINAGLDLSALLGDGRLVTGDVKAVPAGTYARAALETLGLWAIAEPRLAMVENVRAALALVARGEAPLGIVYETDARVEPKVKIVGAFPEGSHPAIIYPVAATMEARAGSGGYLAFLRGPVAARIFEGFGFTVLTAKPAP